MAAEQVVSEVVDIAWRAIRARAGLFDEHAQQWIAQRVSERMRDEGPIREMMTLREQHREIRRQTENSYDRILDEDVRVTLDKMDAGAASRRIVAEIVEMGANSDEMWDAKEALGGCWLPSEFIQSVILGLEDAAEAYVWPQVEEPRRCVLQ